MSFRFRVAWISRTLASIALIATLAVGSAEATVVKGYSLDELALASHTIVQGEVVASEAIYDPTWGHVYTLSHVRVGTVLAGRDRPGDFIVVKQIGGVLDGVHQRVVGTASLPVGAEVVLFTRTDGAFHYLVGMAQGSYTVDRRAGPAPTLRRGDQGLTLVRPFPARAAAPERLRLTSLHQRVAEALARHRRSR